MSFFFHKKDDHPRAEAVVRPPGCTTFEIISGGELEVAWWGYFRLWL
jgi:hypothetical protein